MEINDRVYGRCTVDELVLLKLIESAPLQRLKRINQAGASQYAIKGKDVSRYEHSVGVMLLLKRLGASVEEQIAGLLHDVPHTAFSHVIDFVFKMKDHDFHEQHHEKIVMNSEIPNILREFGFDIKRVLDDHNFPLLERNIPDLCADRVDYTMRDFIASYGFKEKISEYIQHFIVKNNEIIFDDGTIARSFGETFIQMDEGNWSNPKEVALYQILADAIRIGLDKNVISEDDLFKDDKYVYNALRDSGDTEIVKKINMINANFKIEDKPEDYDFHTRTKLRYVNPKYVGSDDEITRVGDTYEEFNLLLEKHKKRVERGTFVKILSS